MQTTSLPVIRSLRLALLVSAGVLLSMYALVAMPHSAHAQPHSLFSTSTATITENDPAAVELGVKFRVATSARTRGVRFYKGPQNLGTHTASLWTSDGTRLASVTFADETASGWQEVRFASPVTIAANTTYVASYFAPVGYYSTNSNFFASVHTNSILTAPTSASASGNGVFGYTASSAFPNQAWNATNYWIDVVVESELPDQSTDTSAPTVPTNVTATAGPTSEIDLAWKASTDNIGISGYNIYRNNAFQGTGGTSFRDSGLSASTPYQYFVRAVDLAGDMSSGSVIVTAPTLGSTTLYYVKPPAGCISIMSYGAASGGTDNMTAFNNAIHAALSTTDKCIYVPAGNFYHNNVIHMRGVSIYGESPTASILTASNPDYAALWYTAGATVANLGFTSTHSLEYNGYSRRDFVHFEAASGILVQNNRFKAPSSSSAIRAINSSNGKIIGNHINGMRAASIYLANVSDIDLLTDWKVAHNTILHGGDDGICVESYDDRKGWATYVNIHNNLILGNNWQLYNYFGRGIAVAGGKHITVDSNRAINTGAAGIIIETVDVWNDKGSSDVTISNNYVENAGQANEHTGYLLHGGQEGERYWVENVLLENNISVNNEYGHYRAIGYVRDITLSNNSWQ